MSTWTGVSGRLGKIKPETKAIAQEIFNEAKKAGHDIWFIWGVGSSKEHASGTALDLMVRNEKAGDWVRNYIWKHRKRLRLRHVIWEQHITSTTVRPGVRVKMADRGNPTANHFDHNHVWFFPGPYRPPVVAPTSPAGPVMKKAATGESVRKVQRFFQSVFPAYRQTVSVRRGVPMVVDGVYGPQTEAWVKEFQKRSGLKVDGMIGPTTWAKMRSYGYK